MADEQAILAELNSQTGKLEWKDLQIHFARGIVIAVAPELDLLDVALHMVKDNKAQIEKWTKQAKIIRANDTHAERWADMQPVFWAVVVPPWLLVQEARDAD